MAAFLAIKQNFFSRRNMYLTFQDLNFDRSRKRIGTLKELVVIYKSEEEKRGEWR